MLQVFFTDSSKSMMWSLSGSKPAATGSIQENMAPQYVQAGPGVFHGSRSYVLQDEEGQVKEAHSISAGLDYPGVGPEQRFCTSLRGSGTFR